MSWHGLEPADLPIELDHGPGLGNRGFGGCDHCGNPPPCGGCALDPYFTRGPGILTIFPHRVPDSRYQGNLKKNALWIERNLFLALSRAYTRVPRKGNLGEKGACQTSGSALTDLFPVENRAGCPVRMPKPDARRCQGPAHTLVAEDSTGA